MQLTSPAPSRIVVNVATKLNEGPTWGLTDSARVEANFPATGSPSVAAYRDVHDEMWDGPVPEPADPRDWQLPRTNHPSPALAQALDGLRQTVAATDLSKLTKQDPELGVGDSYATVHVTFDSKPQGIDQLKPWQERDGRWTVMVRTSLDDLLVEPRLLPVVDAARAVLSAAH